jgi:hypothetical protein
MPHPKFNKDPNATLDYTVDWRTWLPTGDMLVTGTWIVEAGLVVEQEDLATGTCSVWLSSGTAGILYEATNRITTLGGRINDQTLFIECKEK